MPITEKQRQRMKRYRDIHREQINARAREQYRTNPKRTNPLRRELFPVNKQKARIRGRRCYQKNREKMRMDAVKRTYLNKVEVLTHYSTCEYPICAHCGETDIRVLQIDHIEGGGRRHRQQLKKSAGKAFYAWLKKEGFPEGYQVLCSNCNIKKDYEMRNLYTGEM